jgi:OHCU decarboxylase
VTGLTRLDWFNRLSDEEAADELLAVCHSRRWARQVAAGRPYPDPAALQRTADTVWQELSPADWLEAFQAHPRIGEPEGSGGPPGWSPGGSGGSGGPPGWSPGQSGGRSAGWSRQEQAGVGAADRATRDALARGNADYERRFGHVFLIAAAGRDAAEILAALQARLGNDPDTELRVAADEHRRITRLRIDRLLQAQP